MAKTPRAIWLSPGWLPTGCLLVAACQAPATPELALGSDPAAIVAEDFPAPAQMLRGFDAQQPGGGWRVGDEVLYGLKLRRSGTVQHWLLRLRVLEPVALDDQGEALAAVDWSLRINGEPQHFASSQCLVEATVMDEHGVVLGRSEPRLPRDFLDRGIAHACKLVQDRLGRSRRHQLYRRLDLRPLAEATVSAVALLQVVQQDDVLAPLLWQVVEKPSIWSVVSNLGANVVLRPRFHALSEALSPVEDLSVDTWRLPIGLFVNDAPALYLDLFVADPSPPLALAGGMLGATARHPSDPGVEFSLLLLSARRGPPSQ